MRHRATQLVLPFEPALPGRPLILAPRLWPTMTPTTQQQLAKRVAQLLRSMLAAADAGDLIGGHHDEHAAQFGKPGGRLRIAPSWPIFTCANRPPAKSVSIRRAPSCNIGWSIVQPCSAGPRNGLRSLMTTSGSPVRRATAAAASSG